VRNRATDESQQLTDRSNVPENAPNRAQLGTSVWFVLEGTQPMDRALRRSDQIYFFLAVEVTFETSCGIRQ
jgi:hypothetical protein